MIDVAVRVRRLERSRDMKVKKQLEALTDNAFFDRVADEMSDGPTIKEMSQAARILGLTLTVSIEPEMFKLGFNNSTLKEVYSKRRDIVQ